MSVLSWLRGTIVSNTNLSITIIGLVFLLVGCGGSSRSDVFHVSVTSTQNPLVAQFQVGSLCSGQVMVKFGTDTTYGRSTSWYAIAAGQGLTIQVAGMRASTTYPMRAQRNCQAITDSSQDLTFTTGPIPTTIPVPALQVSRPALSSARGCGN